MHCEWENCTKPKKLMKGRISRLGRKRVKPYFFKYCDEHYSEMVRQGSTKRAPKRYTDKNGYIQVFEGGKRIAEHRHVMQIKLGRDLEEFESVHHINGKRNDNRPENLELWLGAIRYGQRAAEVFCPHCKTPYLLPANKDTAR